jgi:hypothetical protein
MRSAICSPRSSAAPRPGTIAAAKRIFEGASELVAQSLEALKQA